MNLLNVFKWKESEVFAMFAKAINEKPTMVCEKNNYAFWNRDSPVLLQAHIDVVKGHKYNYKDGEWDPISRKWVYPEKSEKSKEDEFVLLKCRNIVMREKGVLGGDDRAGVMAMIIINETCSQSKTKIPLPSLLLTNGEETGGSGMRAFISDIKKVGKEILDPVRIVIAMDRKGCSEYVHYTTPSVEVRRYIESFGFNPGFGSWSDSKEITSEWGIPHVNLSIGYYDNHSEKETVHLDEVNLTASRVVSMIKDPIDQRYTIEKTITKWDRAKDYIKDKIGGNESKYDAGNANFAASAKRRKRCEALQKSLNLPLSVITYPYFDYLLTNDLILQGYHVVSSAKAGKTIEDWYYIFDRDLLDKSGKKWKETFGPYSRIYVKSTTPGKFYLAVKDCKHTCATMEEINDRNIEAESNKEVEEKIKKIREEESLKIDKETEASMHQSVDDAYEEMHGYCAAYKESMCNGECHGDRSQCAMARGMGLC